MRVILFISMAAATSGLSLSDAYAQSNLPAIPPVNCPAGTAPSITQIGGGGASFGKPINFQLPSYTRIECPPIRSSSQAPMPPSAQSQQSTPNTAGRK